MGLLVILPARLFVAVDTSHALAQRSGGGLVDTEVLAHDDAVVGAGAGGRDEASVDFLGYDVGGAGKGVA